LSDADAPTAADAGLRGGRRHAVLARLQQMIAIALFAIGIVEIIGGGHWRGPLLAQVVTVAVVSLPLALGPRRSGTAAVLPMVGLALSALLFTAPTSTTAFFAALVAPFLAGLRLDRHRLAYLGLTGATCLCLALRDPANTPVAGYGVTLAFILAAYGAGTWVRGRARLAAVDRDRADRAGEQAEMAAQVALQGERARIARELHDVVAHAVSVIVVQSVAGATVLPTDPGAAIAAFDTIETTGQQALGELRRLLGVLRTVDETMLLAPQPSMAALDDLVARAEAAGLQPRLRIRGEVCALPAGVDLSAYRIVQESLTNVLKHAGPTRVTVDIGYEPAALRLRIRNAAGRRTHLQTCGGHGLLGMRERASLCGGVLDADHEPDGGFVVRASLPFERTCARDVDRVR
jgi:signal transduction histidine kinase